MMVARSWGEGEMVSYYPMGIRFRISTKNRFLRATGQNSVCGQQSYAVSLSVL